MRICLDDTIHTQASVVALGMFDGVHLGHQALLREARRLADEHNVPMVVMTFDRHPLSLIAPDMAPPMLTAPQERMKLLETYGADIVCVSPFTKQLRDLPPEAFIQSLVDHWHPKALVVGFNYNFGMHGAGNPDTLRAQGETLGFETLVIPEVRCKGERVSSTRIRQLLAQGDTAGAEALLGHSLPGEKGK